MTNSVNALTAGIHHIGLTVPNVVATAAFLESALGFKRIGGREEYPSIFVSDGVVTITIWQTRDPAIATPFDRKNVVGLHHLALKVDPAQLDSIYESLTDRNDVHIEFGPEASGASPNRHMMCTIPGGIRLELFAPEPR